jgi:hypothetical protein
VAAGQQQLPAKLVVMRSGAGAGPRTSTAPVEVVERDGLRQARQATGRLDRARAPPRGQLDELAERRPAVRAPPRDLLAVEARVVVRLGERDRVVPAGRSGSRPGRIVAAPARPATWVRAGRCARPRESRGSADRGPRR